MKLLINGDTLGAQKTGIGYYTCCLLEALAALPENHLDIEVAVRKNNVLPSCNGPNRIGKRSISEHSFQKFLPWGPEWLKEYDLLHEPNYIPWKFSGPTVVTVADMSYRICPQFHPRRRVMLMKSLEGRIKAAKHIITISENARREIHEILNIPEERITVTPLGVDSGYHPMELSEEEICQLRDRYQLPDRFFLYVGAIEPRKNLQRLVEAFNVWRRQPENGDLDHKLVMTGGKGWLYGDIFKRIQELGLQDQIVFTGYVPEEDLPRIYNLAQALVYPSLYEGFGLPPLEAMACGTPVISSNCSSIPEVVGESGLLVDPLSVEELSAALQQVSQSSALRQELSQRGLQRARHFTWENCARLTMQVYNDLL